MIEYIQTYCKTIKPDYISILDYIINFILTFVVFEFIQGDHWISFLSAVTFLIKDYNNNTKYENLLNLHKEKDNSKHSYKYIAHNTKK